MEKAIAGTDEYVDALQRFLSVGDRSVNDIYEHLVIADIRGAADVMRPVYDRTAGRDGYKGGPNTGVFLQITCDGPTDIGVPGHSYSFGVVKAAQARGDLEVLTERGRRALRVHLYDVEAHLDELGRALSAALR